MTGLRESGRVMPPADLTPAFPRVLIVYIAALNEHDQAGVSLRGWFSEWPKDHLAQVYSGYEVGERRFCGRTFKIGPRERRLGRVFYMLRKQVAPSVSAVEVGDAEREPTRLSWLREAGRRFVAAVVASGVWELIFAPRLSVDLTKWAVAFRPDVVYVQGYTLSFAKLALELSERCGVPLCFQTGDDWPGQLYKRSAIAPVIRPIVRRVARQLARSASVRIANSDMMAREYEARYGVSFETIMMCDSADRFVVPARRRSDDAGLVSIVYTGNLYNARWKLIRDVCDAAEHLSASGPTEVVVNAYVSSMPAEALEELRVCPRLRLLPALTHEEVPEILKGADVLLLPESFEPTQVEEVRLSISTKAHLYMLAGKPILIYAARECGVASYASSEAWALLVDRRDSASLVEGLRRLIGDERLRSELTMNATRVAARNHDEVVIRRRFRTLVESAAIARPALLSEER